MEDTKFKIEVDGEMKEAEMLKTVSLDGNNYAIYAIDKGDETSDILASRVVKDSEGKDTLVDLESDEERNKIKDIVNACCNASIENTYIEGSNCVIQGIIKVDILFIPIEGLKMIYKISEEIPFEHELEINKLTDTCSVFNTICIEKIDIDLSKNQIDLNIKINRFVEAIDKKPESFIIKGEDKGDYDLSTAPSIIIYICKEDDNLWDIAKKYNTTEEEIAQTNEISIDEELQPGKCLILEKKVAQDE